MPTSAQISIARGHHIPLHHAHTVNVLKYYQYCKYRQSDQYRVEAFLDSLQDHRDQIIKREMADRIKMSDTQDYLKATGDYYYPEIIEVVNRDHEFLTWVGPRIMRVEGHA